MLSREIKKILKKSKIMREIGWWAEINILSQVQRAKDIADANREFERRRKGKEPCTNDKKLIELKDAQKGKACIIVGNGPSLQIGDLEKIQKLGIHSFGLNKINQLYSKTSWRPTYLVVHDHRFILSGESTIDVNEYVKSVQDEKTKYVFFRRQMKKCFNQNLNKKILYFRMPLKNCKQIDPTPIKGDISIQLEDLGSVTTAAMEIAMYMGYKTIYLYGQDFKYDRYIDIDGNYVEAEGAGDYAEGIGAYSEDYKKEYHDLRKTFRGFRECDKYAREHGVRIYNATRGGNLNLFDRVNFDEIIIDVKQ